MEARKRTFLEMKKIRKPGKELMERVNRRRKIEKMIMEALSDGGKTIPELAAQLGLSVKEVTYNLMTCRKYGFVKETGEITEEGYHKYVAVRQEKGNEKN